MRSIEVGGDFGEHLRVFDCYKKALLFSTFPVNTAELTYLVNKFSNKLNDRHNLIVLAPKYEFLSYLYIMKKKETLPDFLKSASESVKRTARRNGSSIAISENGEVKIISPVKNNKQAHRSSSPEQCL